MQVVGESSYKLEVSETSKCGLRIEIVQNKTTGDILHLRTVQTIESMIPVDEILADGNLEALLRQLGE